MRFSVLTYFMLLAVALMACNTVSEAPKERPNIIWLMAEDIAPDLECYGMKAVKTPNLNKLAESGLMFTNCFVTNPICSPSRSAMMTGVHQTKINAQHHRSNRKIPLPENVKPFTYWLREAGYTTILGHEKVRGKGMKIDCNFKTQAIGPYDGVKNFGLFDKKQTLEPQDQPFFAQIQLNVTHRGDWWDEVRSQSKHPVNPDEVELPPYMEDHPVIRLDWAKYLDQIEYMDNEVGMLVQELKDKGMYENTVIIFIGDNGRCNVWGKGYLHDPGLRIPLIVNWPSGIKKNEVREEVISATDITATILDLAGVDVPDYMTGKSFMQDGFAREYAYGARDLWDEIMERSRSLSTGKYRFIRNDMADQGWDMHQAYLEFYRPAVHIMRGLKADGKLSPAASVFFNPVKPKEEFYDLENDPFELNNLIDDPAYAEMIGKMREDLLKIEKEYQSADDTFEPTTPKSVQIFEWMKQAHPEIYEEMLNGKEVGFRRISQMYKNANNEK